MRSLGEGVVSEGLKSSEGGMRQEERHLAVVSWVREGQLGASFSQFYCLVVSGRKQARGQQSRGAPGVKVGVSCAFCSREQ